MATTKKNEVATTEDAQLPAFFGEIDDSLYGAGNSTDSNDNALPFLAVAQKGSDQVNSRKDKYIEGLSAGDLFNTATGRFWKGDDGLQVLPLHYQKNYVEWIPREDGGGYVATHEFSHDTARRLGAIKSADGRGLILPDSGHQLVETAYQFVLLEDAAMPLVIGAASTALGSMRSWMTARNELKIGERRAPSFAFWWNMRSAYKENDKGDWFVPRYTLVGPVMKKETFEMAVEFSKMAREGALNVGRPDEMNGGSDGGDMPF